MRKFPKKGGASRKHARSPRQHLSFTKEGPARPLLTFLTTYMGRTAVRKQRTAEPLSATETDMTRAQKATIALNRQMRTSPAPPHPRHGGSRFPPPACTPHTMRF
jgi:hypothetical protein